MTPFQGNTIIYHSWRDRPFPPHAGYHVQLSSYSKVILDLIPACEMRWLPPHNSELWLVQATQERPVQNEVSGEVRQNLQKGLPFNLRNVGTPVLKNNTRAWWQKNNPKFARSWVNYRPRCGSNFLTKQVTFYSRVKRCLVSFSKSVWYNIWQRHLESKKVLLLQSLLCLMQLYHPSKVWQAQKTLC